MIARVEVANAMADRVVSLLNEGDFIGIKALITDDFLKGDASEQLSRLVAGVHALGTLTKPELILDITEQRHYLVRVNRADKPERLLLLVLGVESATKCFSIGLNAYKIPTPSLVPGVTDNPRKSATDTAVHAAVERYTGQNSLVGIAIATLYQGQERYYNYGEVVRGGKVLPTSRTIFEIGSITKTMTGILLAQAVRDKKLKIDADIRRYLPGKYPQLEFGGKPIRVRHLATHTSGLPASPPGIPDSARAAAYERYTHEQLLADLATIRLSNAPGSRFGYSNMGGGLCGLLLKHAYEQPYAALLQKYLFVPAGMHHSGIALTPEMDKSYAMPYAVSGEQTDRWIVSGIEAAGAVRSSAEDMLSYARFNLGKGNQVAALSHRLLSPTHLPALGMFWLRLDSRTGGLCLHHEGGTGGFSTHLMLLPERELAVVVLINSGEQRPGQLGYEIALRLMNLQRKFR